MDWLSSLFQSVGPVLGNLFGGGGGGGAGASNMTSFLGGPNQFMGSGNKSSGGGSSGGGGFLNSIFPGGAASGITGLGAMGLGQLLSPKVNAPDFSSMKSVQNLQNFNSSPHQLDPAVQQSIQDSMNIQNEQQLRNLRDVYKNARPGTDYTTDSAYQRDLANLNHSMSQNTSDAMANASLASNQQQLGNLTNIAGLDVGKSMAEYGQKAAEKQNFNQAFGNVGSMFLQKGIGMPNYGGLMDLFNNKKAA